ncbi:class I SAM-dependent methyltransferase [Sulfuriroseicoccus oceanibius]|uniref:SAM-dependent methyltransferase n=1 Tax=Sulfuriroseicoccus oceanibius TaxID=2707525 RepID=A0A6B3LCX5_9BACT|nr:SAM-dependent methyltransferase [Sulfuriroseicoccus oceanibius]QQL44876.1 SAM-dependent methyltransferase [Sulfuriroseicoccus oceanibius]
MPHIQQILTEIRRKIESSDSQSIPFSLFMETALYGSDAAYYRQPDRKVGREGDFFTSVSVGRCFGIVLAEWIATQWQQLASPSPCRLIEQGAHNGQLMADILDHLQSAHPECYAALSPTIIEPFATARSRQQQFLGATGHSIDWADDWQDLAPAPGIIVCNELLDAFPFERIRWSSELTAWQQLHVTITPEGEPPFSENFVPIEPGTPLAREIEATPDLAEPNLPDGYVTEVLTTASNWLRSASSTLTQGTLLLIDYGFADTDYYHPERTAGTLRTYFQHNALDDPLQHIGDSDITAHVNFSSLSRHASAIGLNPKPLLDQGPFIVAAAKNWLLATESSGDSTSPAFLKLLRQFNSLTHPASMGSQFKVLVIEKSPTDSHS